MESDDRLEKIRRDYGHAGPGVGEEDIGWLIAEIDRLRSLPTWEQAREQAARVCEAKERQAQQAKSGGYDDSWDDGREVMAAGLADAIRTMTPDTPRADWLEKPCPGHMLSPPAQAQRLLGGPVRMCESCGGWERATPDTPEETG